MGAAEEHATRPPHSRRTHTVLLGGDIGGGKEREREGREGRGARVLYTSSFSFLLLLLCVWRGGMGPSPAAGAKTRRRRSLTPRSCAGCDAAAAAGEGGREGGKRDKAKGVGRRRAVRWPAGKGVQRDGVAPQIPGGGGARDQMGKAAERTAKRGGCEKEHKSDSKICIEEE